MPAADCKPKESGITLAKIDPMIHIDAMHGKYAKSDKVYTRVRKFDNKTFGIALKHPNTNDPATANQQAAQDMFKTVTEAVMTVLADASQKAVYEAAWKKQRKYKSLRGYIFAQLYETQNSGGDSNGEG